MIKCIAIIYLFFNFVKRDLELMCNTCMYSKDKIIIQLQKHIFLFNIGNTKNKTNFFYFY